MNILDVYVLIADAKISDKQNHTLFGVVCLAVIMIFALSKGQVVDDLDRIICSHIFCSCYSVSSVDHL